jgi:hypothetical protein
MFFEKPAVGIWLFKTPYAHGHWTIRNQRLILLLVDIIGFVKLKCTIKSQPNSKSACYEEIASANKWPSWQRYIVYSIHLFPKQQDVRKVIIDS